MENEPVFETEAFADARLADNINASGHRESKKARPSEDLTTILPLPIDPEEDRPLLPGETEDAGRRSSDEGDDVWEGAADFQGLPWWRRPSVYWLLPSFMLFTLAFGGVLVPRLNLILNLICRGYFAKNSKSSVNDGSIAVLLGAENPQCQIPEVQSLVSQFTLLMNLFSGLLAAVTSPKLGVLSDRYGRRRIVAGTIFGMVVSEAITVVAASFPDTVSVNWLLVGAAIDGSFGSFTAAMALTHSYATDCTPPARRNVAFGLFHGCLFTGIAAGPILAGYIIKGTGQVISIFYVALGCHIAFIFFLVFIIPESLTKERQLLAREKARMASASVRPDESAKGPYDQVLLQPMMALTRALWDLSTPLSILWPTEAGSSQAVRRNLLFLASVDTITFGVAMGSMTIVVLYSEYSFQWGNFEASMFMSIVNTGRVLALVVLLPAITLIFRRRSGARRRRNSGSDMLDLSIIRVAVLFDTIGYLGYTLARSGPLFTAAGVMASLGGIGPPTIQSALTKHVPSDRTGQLLGAMGLLHALARVVAPTIFNLIYSRTVGRFSQTVFVCLTSTFALAFVLTWFVRPHVYLDDSDESIGPQGVDGVGAENGDGNEVRAGYHD